MSKQSLRHPHSRDLHTRHAHPVSAATLNHFSLWYRRWSTWLTMAETTSAHPECCLMYENRKMANIYVCRVFIRAWKKRRIKKTDKEPLFSSGVPWVHLAMLRQAALSWLSCGNGGESSRPPWTYSCAPWEGVASHLALNTDPQGRHIPLQITGAN